MYHYQNNEAMRQQEPSLMYLPPSVIERYLNQWITTSIPGYGQVIAYVLDYNPRNGMVSLLIYQEPYYQQQFIQVHNSDLVGIAPYMGPIPPRPRPRPPRPPWQGPGQSGGYPGQQPWQPGGYPGQQPWQPGGYPGQQQSGGGFLPWLWQQGMNLFGSSGR